MNDTIKIRLAVLADAFQISKVQKETWIFTYPNEELGITAEDIRNSRSANTTQLWQSLLKNKNLETNIWVATDLASQVVGFCLASREFDQEIKALYVLPEFHRQGIGTSLMQNALKWFDRSKSILLSVADYNDSAIQFYKSHGFTVYRKVTHPFQFEIVGKTISIPLIGMQLRLS